MLKWAIIFAVIAGIAAILGFGGIAGIAMGIALGIVKFLFFAALALAMILLALVLLPRRRGLRTKPSGFKISGGSTHADTNQRRQ